MGEFKLGFQSGNAQFGSSLTIFVPCDLEIWWMPLKNNRAPILHYGKLCASFQNHETEVTVWKRTVRVKIDDILSRATSNLDGWPWKTIRHPFYITSTYVHHFNVFGGEFKLALQPGNAQFGSKSAIFSLVTLKLTGPWKTSGHLFYAATNFAIVS